MEKLFQQMIALYQEGGDARVKVLAFCTNLKNLDYHARQFEEYTKKVITESLAVTQKDADNY